MTMTTAIREASSGTVPELRTQLSIFARVRVLCARVLFILGSLVIAVLVISRITTDQWLYSQFAFWVPAPFYLSLAAILLAAERVIALPRATPRWRAPSWSLLVLCAIWICILAFRGIARSESPVSSSSSLTIVHWNMSSPDMLSFDGTLADFRSCRQADIILLGITVPDEQYARMVRGLGNDWTFRRLGVFGVASRFPIDHASIYGLGLSSPGGRHATPRFQDFYNIQIADRFGLSRREFDLPDPGYVLSIKVLTPQSPISIRMLDLPSNPFRSRMEIASSASARIRALVNDGLLDPFPDMIIGDCNIPVGSASLQLLAGNLIPASALSASGDREPTWPRAHPFLRIDNAWVHPASRVLNYRTFDGGISDHRGQSLTIERGTSTPAR